MWMKERVCELAGELPWIPQNDRRNRAKYTKVEIIWITFSSYNALKTSNEWHKL